MTIFKEIPPEEEVIFPRGNDSSEWYGPFETIRRDIKHGKNEYYVVFSGHGAHGSSLSAIFNAASPIGGVTVSNFYSEDIKVFAAALRGYIENNVTDWALVKDKMSFSFILCKRGTKGLLDADEILRTAPKDLWREERPIPYVSRSKEKALKV